MLYALSAITAEQHCLCLLGTRSLDDSDDDDRLLGPDGNDLVDSGFLVHKTLDQAIDAAAEESLIRLLEAGPCVLDSVKEALGALKVLLAGLQLHASIALLVDDAAT